MGAIHVEGGIQNDATGFHPPGVSGGQDAAFLGHQIGGFLGAWLGGYVFDTTGSYFGVWMIAIAASMAAAVMCLPIDERPLARPVPA